MRLAHFTMQIALAIDAYATHANIEITKIEVWRDEKTDVFSVRIEDGMRFAMHMVSNAALDQRPTTMFIYDQAAMLVYTLRDRGQYVERIEKKREAHRGKQ